MLSVGQVHPINAGAAAPILRVHRTRVVVSLLTVYFIWGSAYLGIRVAIQDIPPFLMSGSRVLLAGGLLYAYLRLRGAPPPTGREWIDSAKAGFLLIGLANALLVYAQESVDSGLAAIVLASAALWGALFTGIWERWPSRPECIGLLIGFAGVILLNANLSLWAHPMAAVSLLLCSVVWAYGSIASRHMTLPRGAMASATQLLTGGVMLLALSGVAGEHIRHVGTASLAAWIYLAIFSSLAGYSAYTYLIHNTRPALALSYEYVNPAVAVLLGAVFENESITGIEIVAMLLTAGSVYFLMQGRGAEGHHHVPARAEGAAEA